MSDYIDQDAITRAFRETDPDLFTEYDEHYGVESGYSHEAVESIIAGLPAADVVEVVRCDNCVSHGNCLTEDTFCIARIDNPYCCAGKKMERQDG